jgi:hypothetical protein
MFDNEIQGVYDDLLKAMISCDKLLGKLDLCVSDFTMMGEEIYFTISSLGETYKCEILPITINENLF